MASNKEETMNLTQIRNETPHCKDKIFLNSAGSSLMPQCVVKTMKDYLDKEAELGGYYLADLQKKEINEFYTELAQLINCKPSNIGFCTSATDAYAKVLSSFHFAKNDVIITTDDDYVSNYIQFIALKKRFGISIRRIKNTERGDLDIDHLHSLVKAHAPRLVAISHIPT
ncbi:MAG: aminotransferase class V-fold PLP-dependent enzyme, partial [Fulvivirga sp.]|nr:aminotransferase class V-fold PLP-dependent enzyme [Fulvivirga sp.]